MTAVIAIGALSGLGRGEAAYDAGPVGEPARTALGPDPLLEAQGLVGARSARVPCVTSTPDRATGLLLDALEQCTAELDTLDLDWRELRLGLCLGTSSGGMDSAEAWLRARHAGLSPSTALAERATYFAPFVAAVEHLGIPLVRRSQVVTACASSTIAIGRAKRWLDLGLCDLVLAGGYDALGLFVAAGFGALRALAKDMPQPFRVGRDGMSLAEGAAVLALARPDLAPARFHVTGYGASVDAVHITAPDREAGGMRRAGTAALAEASLAAERIDLVSAHGTATPYNDAAEAKAIHALAGDALVHPFKAQVGHTLGAAGALELLAAARALEQQVAPAAAGDAPIDPDARVSLLTHAEPRALGAGLKLSAAFGGVAAALAFERMSSDVRSTIPRGVCARAAAVVDDVDRPALARATGLALDRIARIDELGQLALAAVAALIASVGRDALDGAGVVAGYGLATLDTNARYLTRLVDKGPRWVDPRLFPATSPNAGAGHVAIAYGLTGPNFAVCRGLDGAVEALQAGVEVVAAGDAPRMVVVAADDDGPAASDWYAAVAPGIAHRRGAVAVLLEAGDEGAVIGLDDTLMTTAAGHLSLRRWWDDVAE